MNVEGGNIEVYFLDDHGTARMMWLPKPVGEPTGEDLMQIYWVNGIGNWISYRGSDGRMWQSAFRYNQPGRVNQYSRLGLWEDDDSEDHPWANTVIEVIGPDYNVWRIQSITIDINRTPIFNLNKLGHFDW